MFIVAFLLLLLRTALISPVLWILPLAFLADAEWMPDLGGAILGILAIIIYLAGSIWKYIVIAAEDEN